MISDKKLIFGISILIFSIKWFFILSFNHEYDFITKILFNVDDRQYFTYIQNLSNFNFSPTFNLDIQSNNFIALPIYSIIFHSFFFKIFQIYGFILLEFFLILIFFYFLTKFFNRLGLVLNISLFLALLFFCLPNIIDYFHLFNIPYISSLKEFYNMRIPRPAVTHLYLFFFFYLLVSKDKKNIFKKKELALVGIVFALMWGSFYYNLAISGITFILYYFYLNHKANHKVTNYLKDGLIVFIFFIIFSIPIICIVLYAEPDYLIRVGLIDLNLEKKQILLNHFINQLFSLKFLIVFFTILIFYYFLRSKEFYKEESLNILLFIFFGSFLGPIIFIIISPTISEIYHFSNMLVSLTFFVFTIFLLLVILIYLNTKLNSLNFLINISILLLILIYGLQNYSINKKKSLDIIVKDNNELMSEIQNINLKKNSSILTFDGDVQTNLILNGYKNFDFIIGINTSLDDKNIENQLISIFKFLQLHEDDFFNFIKNKKRGWRFINENIGKTFYMKYQANKLITFNNSDDFSSVELNAINNSSPLHSQQLIIPAFEIKRLIQKFKNSKNIKDLQPDLIIFSRNDELLKNIIINDEYYCSKIINKSYKIYYNKDLNLTCKL